MVVPPGGGRVRNVSTGIAMGAISFLYFIPLFRSFHIEATPTTSVVSFGLLSLLFSRGLLLASFCCLEHEKTHSEIGLCPNVRRASSVWDRDVSGKVAWCSGRRIPQFSAPGLETDSRAKVGAPQANGVLINKATADAQQSAFNPWVRPGPRRHAYLGGKKNRRCNLPLHYSSSIRPSHRTNQKRR